MVHSTDELRVVPLPGAADVLTGALRAGAQKLLAQAIDAAVADWIDQHQHCRDADGHRRVVRNGHLPARTITTGVGPVAVRRPRARDRRPAELAEKFSSKARPPYLRKTKAVEELIPWLYLKGISTGDFSEARAALLGPEAPGLSASTITRLKGIWQQEYQDWSKRSLAGKPYVYVWAAGVYFNIRLEGGRQCIRVLLGATADGKKELIAIQDGQRESEQSWKERPLDCQSRGLTVEPSLARGDGALGFWKAARQLWSEAREQRCWVHKTAPVLDKLPKGVQPKAKRMLHAIYLAESKAAAGKAFDPFVATYQAKFPKATECLAKDRNEPLTFSDFPAEHWLHLRTTNPIESVFATVRLRTDKTKGTGTREACLAMAFKLREAAAKRWRCLNGAELLEEVIQGASFVVGVKQEDAA
jgi:transposase-like protein